MNRLPASSWIFASTALAVAVASGCSITGDCTNLPGLIDCKGNGACTSLASDVYNCGACGHLCENGTFCSRGTCVTSGGPPIITSVGSPTIVAANADKSHTLKLTVWYTDDAEIVSDLDFGSAALTLTKQPLQTPSSTGSADISVTLPATTPTGTFAFTIDVVSASGAVSVPFNGSVVLE